MLYKKIIIICILSVFMASALHLTGCNFEADVNGNLNVDDQTFVSNPPTPMFYGVVDGTGYYFDDTVFQCIQGFIYDRQDTAVPVVGTDGIDGLCKPEIYQVVNLSQSSLPVYGQ